MTLERVMDTIRRRTQHLGRCRHILEQVAYKPGWHIDAYQDGEGVYLQVVFRSTDSFTGKESIEKGRKWRLSPHMVKNEIVLTAFKAILTAEEHEAREAFTYKGQRIYGPHFDVDALAELAESGAIEYRKRGG